MRRFRGNSISTRYFSRRRYPNLITDLERRLRSLKATWNRCNAIGERKCNQFRRQMRTLSDFYFNLFYAVSSERACHFGRTFHRIIKSDIGAALLETSGAPAVTMTWCWWWRHSGITSSRWRQWPVCATGPDLHDWITWRLSRFGSIGCLVWPLAGSRCVSDVRKQRPPSHSFGGYCHQMMKPAFELNLEGIVRQSECGPVTGFLWTGFIADQGPYFRKFL